MGLSAWGSDLSLRHLRCVLEIVNEIGQAEIFGRVSTKSQVIVTECLSVMAVSQLLIPTPDYSLSP